MIILGENFKWHLEAFASELFIHSFTIYFLRIIRIIQWQRGAEVWNSYLW